MRLVRYGTDCYAYAMLAAGQSTSSSRPACKPTTSSALIPIIEKAGGVVTTLDGGPAEKGGDIIAAATPELHAAAMEMLNGLIAGSADDQPSYAAVAARHEGVEGGEKLLAVDVRLLQDFVARAVDGEQRADAQLPRIALDRAASRRRRRRRRRRTASGSGSWRMKSGSLHRFGTRVQAARIQATVGPPSASCG